MTRQIENLEQLSDSYIKEHNLVPVLDTSKEYGVVLEGGGAKGSYQIGVWKALSDAGIKIKGVAGTSVGALNGAMMASGELDVAFKVWSEVSYSTVMDVDDETFSDLLKGDLKVSEVLSQAWAVIKNGGVDISPLRQLINEILDEDKIRSSGREFFLVTFCLSEMKAMNLGLEDIPYGELEGFLLASAYLYGFKNEKIYGKHYFDGSIVSRLPLNLLLDKGYQDIIEIHLYRFALNTRLNVPKEANIYEVVPRVSLGNVVAFEKKKSLINMLVGYYDGLRLLYGLEGLIYYLLPMDDEEWFSKKMENLSKGKKMEIIVQLKLAVTSSDKELFLAMLEASGKLLKIQKYHIYTIEELHEKVKERYLIAEQKVLMGKIKEVPQFVQYCCGL